MKIVLFDIDGTLLKTGPHVTTGNRPISRFNYAINEVFGVDIPLDLNTMEGKTDTGIFLDSSEVNGINRADIAKHMEELFRAEIVYMKGRVPTASYEPAEGVTKLLDTLRSRNYHTGLLTGNVTENAELKLNKAGIWHYFEFGGFGEVSEIRSKLIDHAIGKAELKFNTKISRRDVFYFGDAPRDVEAGQAAGVVMIGVATGMSDRMRLEASHPDYVLDDLADTDQIMKIIEG